MEEENKRPLSSYFNNGKEVYNSDKGFTMNEDLKQISDKIKELKELEKTFNQYRDNAIGFANYLAMNHDTILTGSGLVWRLKRTDIDYSLAEVYHDYINGGSDFDNIDYWENEQRELLIKWENEMHKDCSGNNPGRP